MLIVDNKVIETPIKDILEMLRQQLFLSRINRLDVIEYKQNNARVRCPFHKNGQERTPSCEILLEDKTDGTQAGTVYCFGCGYKANIIKFIADCLNVNYRKASEWLIGISTYSLLDDTRDIEDIELSINKVEKEDITEVSLDELREYDYIHEYMFKRKLTDDIIEKFEVGYDPKTDSLTFPVYVDGRCRFVAKRRVSFKRFDMPQLDKKPIYALDYITDDEIIVCESVIDALTCWVYGRQAVALFGTGSTWQIEQLNNIYQRKIILALDGDEAGRKGIKRFQKGLTNKIVTVLELPEGKDINDLTKEEFDALEEVL